MSSDAVARDQLENAEPQAVLAWAYRSFARPALVASFQLESVVLIDMATRLGERPEVITLDTGRLPEATHEYMERIARRYPIRLQVAYPDPQELAELVGAHGPNLFRTSPELRHACCAVRKTRVLERALAGRDAWVTGLRRDQAASRRATPVVQEDPLRPGLVKIAPLAAWSRAQVWEYAREHGIEAHPLYAAGYASIGCAPCTRATRPGEDERAGRWWWERTGVRECGLHWAAPGGGR